VHAAPNIKTSHKIIKALYTPIITIVCYQPLNFVRNREALINEINLQELPISPGDRGCGGRLRLLRWYSHTHKQPFSVHS